jgi:hypothetical protein
MGLSLIALRGLGQASARFQEAAAQVGASGASPDGAPADVVDLSVAVTEMLSSRDNFAAHIQVLNVANEWTATRWICWRNSHM